MVKAANNGHETRMLVDGKLIDADSGATFNNVNPATEEVLGVVADSSKSEMRRAIAGARRAFDETSWSTDKAFRKRCLEQLQEALEGEREELREELILEVGCPRMTTQGPQLDGPLEGALRFPIKLIDEFQWETALPDAPYMGGTLNARRIWKEPVGVVGAIVPWNFPLEVTLNKVGQALATGNTMVLKPAPDTPWNATRLGRLVAEKTDIPAGVFNVVTSSDHLVGEELTLSPDVDLISFTGSTAVGQAHHGEGRPHPEKTVSRTRAASPRPSCSTMPTSRPPPWPGWPSASTPARVAPFRPGCCCPSLVTRKASSCSRECSPRYPTATRSGRTS